MKLVMDSDALIKGTKVSLKEVLCSRTEVLVSQEVEREVVSEGLAGGYADALPVQTNIREGRIQVQAGRGTPSNLRELPIDAGELSTLSLYLEAEADAIVSDDARFLRTLDELRIPYATLGSLLVLARRRGWLDSSESGDILQELRPLISDAEYHLTSQALEALR